MSCCCQKIFGLFLSYQGLLSWTSLLGIETTERSFLSTEAKNSWDPQGQTITVRPRITSSTPCALLCFEDSIVFLGEDISLLLSVASWVPPRALLPLLCSVSCAGGIFLRVYSVINGGDVPLLVLILTFLWLQGIGATIPSKVMEIGSLVRPKPDPPHCWELTLHSWVQWASTNLHINSWVMWLLGYRVFEYCWWVNITESLHDQNALLFQLGNMSKKLFFVHQDWWETALLKICPRPNETSFHLDYDQDYFPSLEGAVITKPI